MLIQAIKQCRQQCVLFVLFMWTLAVHAQPTPVRIAVQPGNYSSIAYRVADKLGYWAEMGLRPRYQTFAAGMAQIKAHEEWDIATMGAVPALIGARDHDLITIAVANDESLTNALVVKKALASQWRAAGRIPPGTRIAVTLNSTGDYAAQTCLALWGGATKSDMVYLGKSQADAMAAGLAGEADALALWAPNVYVMEEQHGYEVFCSGKSFSPGVYGVTVAGRSWAQQNPETVARAMAVIARANRWVLNNPSQAWKIHQESAATDGIKLSDSAAQKDVKLRPLFDLDEHIEVMQGSGRAGPDGSRLAKAFFSLNIFLNEGRLQSRIFKASSFVDASYLLRVRRDPKLMEFVNKP